MLNPDKTYHLTVTLEKVDGWGFAIFRPTNLGAFVVPSHLVKKFCHFLGIPALGVSGSEYELPVHVSPTMNVAFSVKRVTIRADFEGLSWDTNAETAELLLH